MVKHSRRAHHSGGGPVDPDPESEDEDDQSPVTPNAPHNPWGMNNPYIWATMPQAPRNILPHQNIMPLRDYGRVNSLGSNGPEYQPHHNDEFAQHMRRMSYQSNTLYGQQKLASVPSQHHQQSQPTPTFKIEAGFDSYQAQQPRTADIHNSPDSHYSALSPTNSATPSDAYTHQPMQPTAHVPHNNGQHQRMGYEGQPQQSSQQSMGYYQPENMPNVTRNMFDPQTFQPTSGPIVPTSMPMISSAPMDVSTYGEAPAGLTAFHNHMPHPLQTYSLPTNGWMGMKDASGMLLPNHRYQHGIQQ